MDEAEKKQKVIHTRIPASLDRELKKKATRLGMSVSNLVRNVLLNTLDLVEHVVADSVQVAASAHDLASGELPSALGGQPSSSHRSPGGSDGSVGGASRQILGWQELILNVNALCARCNAILPRGSRAVVSVVQGSAPLETLCLGCVPSEEGSKGDAIMGEESASS